MSKIIQNHVLKQYQVIKQLGSGAYGYVWQVICKKDNKKYALKKIFDAFRNNMDSQRTFRQIEVLTNLKSQYIINLNNVIESKNKNDIYLVFQHMEADLNFVNNSKILQRLHKKAIIYQILLSLQYLQSKKLMHRDLKPSNILINSQSKIKLCDFGLIRSFQSVDSKQNSEIFTQEVATKWYRAPQILLGSKNYNKQVDMWSLGCIVAQILLKKPLFNKFSNYQILTQMISLDDQFSENDIQFLDGNGLQEIIKDSLNFKKSFNRVFGNQNQEYFQLIKGCLRLNPKKRISIENAKKLPLFDQIKDFIKQTPLNNDSTGYQFSLNDNQRFQTQVYRNKIKQIIRTKFRTSQNQILGKNLEEQVVKTIHKKKCVKSLENQERLKSPHKRPFNLDQKKYQKNQNLNNSALFRQKLNQSMINTKRTPSNIKQKQWSHQKSSSCPYLLPLKVYKKPYKIALPNQPLIQQKQNNSFYRNGFLNKYSKKGKQYNLVSQITQSQRQQFQQRQKIKDISKKIIYSIYGNDSVLKKKKYKKSLLANY